MTQIEMLLLSLLYDKDYHGYEFEQIIEKKNLRSLVNIGFSSIYNSLNKLEKNGYIVSRFERGNGSIKKRVYSIKNESRQPVKDNIFNTISEYKSDPNDFKLAFTFSYLLSKDELKEALSIHKGNLFEKSKVLAEERDELIANNEKIEPIRLLERTIAFLDMDILWLDKCINGD